MTKLITTPHITDVNNLARRLGGRVLNPNSLPRLDPYGIHVIASTALMDDSGWVRVSLLLRVRDQSGPVTDSMDIPIKDYNSLPEYPDPKEKTS